MLLGHVLRRRRLVRRSPRRQPEPPEGLDKLERRAFGYDAPLDAWESPITRKLTTSSTSTPRLRRLSRTACASSVRLCAGFHDASAPRTAPTFVTIVRSSG